MSSQGTLPVIIPAYRGGEALARALASVADQGIDGVETFVHDNSVENFYYTAAVNLGLRKYAFREDVQYLLVLNQDAELFPGALSRLVIFMEARPICGIASPIQVAKNDAQRVTFAGGEKLWPWGHHYAGEVARFPAPRPIAWASGAAMMLRSAMVREIGLLDQNLRQIGSDSDY